MANSHLTLFIVTTAWFAAFAPSLTFAGNWPICSTTKRITCIVDGDTFWKDGVKYRIEGVDTPEAKERAQCAFERDAADKATGLLQQIFETSALMFETHGKDRHGRVLVSVYANGVNVSDILISANLGRAYDGRKRDPQQWCKVSQ